MWILFIIILIVSIFILLFSYWVGNFFYELALNVEKSKAFIAKHHTNTETQDKITRPILYYMVSPWERLR